MGTVFDDRTQQIPKHLCLESGDGMTRRWDGEEMEYVGEEELQELPEAQLVAPEPCCVCGKPDCTNGCFRCGKPVCYNTDNYLADSTCGGWLLDSWHSDALNENAFWCQYCFEEDEIIRQLQHEATMASITRSHFDSDEAYQEWLINNR
jgi:hypothetical protein